MNEALRQLQAAIADLQSRPAWAASDDDSLVLVDSAQIAITQLTALQAIHVRELDARGYPAKQGATNVAAWLRDRLRISIYTARRLVKLGEQTDVRPLIAEALTAGTVTVEQSEIIAAALRDLPADIDATTRDACETALIAQAAALEPSLLRTVGDRILDYVAPEVADAALQAKLDRDERRAHETRAFTMTPAAGGTVRLSGSLDAESAAVIRAAIDPLCKPTPGPDGARDERQPAHRRADALVEVCALALATDVLPANGGNRPHLTATFHLDPCSGAISAGMLDTGERLSPAAIRRLACDAGIIPAVLGSRGEVLDLGRTRRLYSGPARHALAIRDGGCAFPGCDRPVRWTEAHHVVSWFDGGRTDQANGVLLCRRHHRSVHHDGWTVHINGDNLPEFIPPPYVDPRQTPLRNIRFHLRT